MDIKFITKDKLRAEAKSKIESGIIVPHDQMCDVVSPVLNGRSGKIGPTDALFDRAMKAKTVGRESIMVGKLAKEYGSGFDIPRFCHGKDKEMSVREMLKAGVFNDTKMSSNSLIPDWQSLWDALRIDISIRKAAQGTIRENIYNIENMPNSSKIFKSTEFFPYAVIFEENNGEGQSVRQGETRAGQYEDIEHFIYAAGFTWTLLADLFDESLNTTRISDAVSVGYDAKRDDLAISPILNFSYSGAQQTAASTVGTQRQELLYNTIQDAIDDLAERVDPVTLRKIDASDLTILASPNDARHISHVIGGFNTNTVGGQDAPKSLDALSEISQIIAYDGEVIEGRAETTTYSGVTNGTAYLIRKNRYMNVGIKRNLQMESDMTPDVTKLSQEERSWYFVEGQQTTGIQYFIQEITLPTW